MVKTTDLPTPPRRQQMLRRWPDWVPYAATLWAAGYGLVALGWTYTGTAVPIANGDDGDSLALLGGVPADAAAPLFAAIALAAGAIGLAMARVDRPVPRSWRRFALGFGTMFATALLLVLPDVRLLALVGYLPMILVRAPFDVEFRAQLAEALSGVYVHQVVAVIGGVLWAAATFAFARRTGAVRPGWTTPASAARWGRVAVYVAAAIPALYALTRWIWVLGVPLGIDPDLHAAGMADGSLWSGAWLGSFALVGTVLTLGLVQRWGEVVPRWVPVVGGRRVPVSLAVVPAAAVSVLATSGGLSLLRSILTDDTVRLADDWAAYGPALLWPVWGVALAAGTLAYYARRRPSAR